MSPRPRRQLLASLCMLIAFPAFAAAPEAAPSQARAALRLRELDPHVLPEAQRDAARSMIPDDLKRRLRAANQRSTAQWRGIQGREDWERFRDDKLRLLVKAVGPRLAAAEKIETRQSGTIRGDGFTIRNLVFESRPKLWVTANLYAPAEPRAPMPGLLICHSHHTPKEHRELQELGMTWARQGCLVLVPDMLGHGERRQHPFATADDYPEPFRVSRQDYYFRFDTGMQLHLAGETLMGWILRDTMRAVGVLLDQPGVDPERIVVLGSVAGGGDPAAVTAALDARVAAAVPFNFGGAEPESPYPLPDDAEATFNYAGSGSFESTRNLRRSAADGFLPWVTVGSIAPRPLVYAHEFAWDRPRDPVWQRFERIWDFYEAGEHLDAMHGSGSVRGRPPEATHCTHIGRLHRRKLDPILLRWFGVRVTPEDEHSAPREREELLAMTPALKRELNPQRLCDLLPELAGQRLAAVREELEAVTPGRRREQLRARWSAVLGDVEPLSEPRLQTPAAEPERMVGATVERLCLEVEPGIVVPILLLRPLQVKGGERTPCAVAVAQGGKAGFLRRRAEEIAGLLAGGAAVCLPDLRGLGETAPDGSRERWGAMTAHASTELMLGGTMVGARLRDLRSVLRYLRTRGDVDPARIAIWGDSFSEPNPADRRFAVPRHMDDRPRCSEPLGGLLALLTPLFEEDVAAVYVRGGLSDFHGVLAQQFVYVPADAVVPGALKAGDLPDLAAGLAPCPLRLDETADAYNRRLAPEAARAIYRPAADSYTNARAGEQLSIGTSSVPAVAWLLRQLGPAQK